MAGLLFARGFQVSHSALPSLASSGK